MILHDVRVYGEKGLKHIQLLHDRIHRIVDNRIELGNCSDDRIEMEGAIALPGFINSHDHLDFNLFPSIANRIYSNYTEWGSDIHKSNSEQINEVLNVPQSLRVRWGIYKNLLNGFTTVVNHGKKLAVPPNLLNVYQQSRSLHSPGFEKGWKWKLKNPFRGDRLIAMHIGEGTDTVAVDEIDEVINHNLLKKKIVAIHAVPVTNSQAGHFHGIVWCPASNFFLLGKTAAINQLNDSRSVVFGTDSTLTASWNCWDQFRQAINSGMVTSDELVQQLTINPSRLWGIQDRGIIAENKIADLVFVKNGEPLFSNDPGTLLLVMYAGKPVLVSGRVAEQLKNADDYSGVSINSRQVYVRGDLHRLTKEILSYYPGAEIPFQLDQ